MKKMRAVTVAGVLLLVVAMGCAVPEKIQREEVLGTPTDTMRPTPVSDSEDNGKNSTAPTNPSHSAVFSSELRWSFTEETEEEKDGEFVYFTSAISYPVFEGKYAETMNRFVAALTESFREELQSAKENARFDYEEAKNGAYGLAMFPEEEELTISVLWSNEQYHTLFTRWFGYSGGAHPNTFCKAYVVDVTTGEGMTLENMIRPYGVTEEEVISFATDRIRKEHGDELFETDNEWALEEWVYGFTKENQWYFNENGLVVFANPYDIAAYVYGMIECEISYEELEQGLKKN